MLCRLAGGLEGEGGGVRVLTSGVIAAIVFGCVFGGALGGMLIRAALPEEHLAQATQDVIKLGTGMVATLAALVIGLLLFSAKNSYEVRDTELRQFAANLILLDRQLVHYGAETKEARDLLRHYVSFKIDSTWTGEASRPVTETHGWTLLEDVQDRLRGLSPTTDAQHWLQTRALQISAELERTRWLLDVQKDTAIPKPFLLMLTFWLTVIFGSFGLLAPRNATTIAILLVCALSIAGAVFLILDMDRPFFGVVRISSAPMREALATLSQ
jgi:hypothetical protein